MEYYISPKSGQSYMINVLGNQWLFVTFIDLQHTKQMLKYNAVVVEFSENTGRKCTVPSVPSRTQDQWCANPFY